VRPLRWRAVLWLAVVLCASSAVAEDGAISIAGDPVHFSDLRCLGGGTVVAAATIRTDGALLHSTDGGLQWSVVVRGGDLAGVTPHFIEFPIKGRPPPLHATGYRTTGVLQFVYPLGPTLEAADGGTSWSAAPPLLPAGLRSNDPMARVDAPIVVDGDGRLGVGRKHPDPAVLLSDDHGVTWAESRVPGIETALYHLVGDGLGRLVAVGAKQPLFGSARLLVAQSDDSGRTWSVAMDEVADHLACSPRLIGQVNGALMIYNPCHDYGKRYYLSGDGGRKWSPRVFERHFRGAYELVAAIDDRRWVALSQEGPNRSIFAWISDNAGEDWRGLPTRFAAHSGDLWLHMQTMLPLADGGVLAYLGDGQLLRSEDRGESWKLVDTGLPRRTTLFMGSACTDGKGLVVLAGNKGMQVRSTDSGLTWQRGRMAPAPQTPNSPQ